MLANPLNRRRAVTLTPDQFGYGFANALSEDEAASLDLESIGVKLPLSDVYADVHPELEPEDESS